MPKPKPAKPIGRPVQIKNKAYVTVAMEAGDVAELDALCPPGGRAELVRRIILAYVNKRRKGAKA